MTARNICSGPSKYCPAAYLKSGCGRIICRPGWIVSTGARLIAMGLGLKLIAVMTLLAAWSSDAAIAGETAAGNENEIRIGNVMPYTGVLAAFGSIGRAEAAYFDMINQQGGINGRKVRFISYDDSADPVTTREQTRKLVETDKVDRKSVV